MLTIVGIAPKNRCKFEIIFVRSGHKTECMRRKNYGRGRRRGRKSNSRVKKYVTVPRGGIRL